MPVVAGTVVWSRGLIERIKAPMDKLLALNRSLRILTMDRPEDKASQTVEFYHQLVRTIGEYHSSLPLLNIFMTGSVMRHRKSKNGFLKWTLLLRQL